MVNCTRNIKRCHTYDKCPPVLWTNRDIFWAYQVLDDWNMMRLTYQWEPIVVNYYRSENTFVFPFCGLFSKNPPCTFSNYSTRNRDDAQRLGLHHYAKISLVDDSMWIAHIDGYLYKKCYRLLISKCTLPKNYRDLLFEKPLSVQSNILCELKLYYWNMHLLVLSIKLYDRCFDLFMQFIRIM